MLDFLLSLEGLTSGIAFVAAIWGLSNKIKASKALRSEAQVRAEAKKQREKLLDELGELAAQSEQEVDALMVRLDAAAAVARDEMAVLRGQIGKLMDMIISGEELKLDTDEGDVVVTGSTGEVRMRENTLNKVVEATAHAKYKRGMGGKLKRIVIEDLTTKD